VETSSTLSLILIFLKFSQIVPFSIEKLHQMNLSKRKIQEA